MSRSLATGVLLASVFAFGALGACSDGASDSPLLGVWRVDTHTYDGNGCSGPGEPEEEPVFVKFIVTKVFTDVVEMVECTSATMCDDSAGLFGRLFSEDIDDGLRSSIYTAAGEDSNCVFGAYRADAVLGAGDRLRIEARRYQSEPGPVADCDADVAEAMFAQLTCASLDIITASRVEVSAATRVTP